MPVSFPLFGQTNSSSGPIEWLIVGLGNPGPKYDGTRHNVGFEILKQLAEAEHMRFDKSQNEAVLARGQVEGVSVALVKPLTYMNLSGKSVGPLARFYKIPVEQILVIYDDLDLATAQLRIRPKGGAGGHKGMTSIIQHLGSQNFPRFRVGIGRPQGRMPVEAYVLQPFTADESKEMAHTYQQTQDAIRALLSKGLDYAMNNFNRA